MVGGIISEWWAVSIGISKLDPLLKSWYSIGDRRRDRTAGSATDGWGAISVARTVECSQYPIGYLYSFDRPSHPTMD